MESNQNVYICWWQYLQKTRYFKLIVGIIFHTRLSNCTDLVHDANDIHHNQTDKSVLKVNRMDDISDIYLHL